MTSDGPGHFLPSISGVSVQRVSSNNVEKLLVEKLKQHHRGDGGGLNSKLWTYFRRFDGNRDGFIDKFEFVSALKRFGISATDEVAQLVLQKYGKSGKVNYSQFLNICQNHAQEDAIFHSKHDIEHKQRVRMHKRAMRSIMQYSDKEIEKRFFTQLQQRVNKRNVRKAFRYLDVDNRGYLDVQQFQTIMQRFNIYIPDCDLQVILKRWDTDKNGKISFDEFESRFSKFIKEYNKRNYFAEDNEKELNKRREWLQNHSIPIKEVSMEVAEQRFKRLIRQGKFGFSVIRMFRSLDVNKSGFIDVREFKRLMEKECFLKISKETLNKLISKWDNNNDGKINYEEFVRYFGDSFMGKAKLLPIQVKKSRKKVKPMQNIQKKQLQKSEREQTLKKTKHKSAKMSSKSSIENGAGKETSKMVERKKAQNKGKMAKEYMGNRTLAVSNDALIINSWKELRKAFAEADVRKRGALRRSTFSKILLRVIPLLGKDGVQNILIQFEGDHRIISESKKLVNYNQFIKAYIAKNGKNLFKGVRI